MKIREKITFTTVGVIILTSLLSGIFIFILINDGFASFLREQIAIIELQPIGPSIRHIFEQLQDYRELVSRFNRTIIFNIFFSSLVGILIGLVISFILSSRIVDPIEELMQKVKKIRQHDYSSSIEIEGDDEISMLGNEFEKLRKDLLRVENLRKDLVSDLAHELNTPLTTIRGILEGIEEKIYKPDKANLSIIKEESENLSALIERMRHFNEIRTRNYQSKFESVNINKELRSLKMRFENDLKAKNISINYILDTDIKDTKINKLAFHEIISNLISNAIKYSKEKGEIEIISDKTEDGIEISVKDSGIGMKKEDLNMIFERFFRVDKSRSKKSGGLGLGLAIVKELTEACGWDIKVSSKYGKGSEFTLIIPQ